MNLPNLTKQQTEDILARLDVLVSYWELKAPKHHKFDKKSGLAGISLPEDLIAIPYSILKDSRGNYYLIDNDQGVTKAAESKGAQGGYKRLFPVEKDASGHFALLENNLGMKTVKNFSVKKPAENSSAMFDIFGAAAVPAQQADEIGALKKLDRYVDEAMIGKKKYIIMRHVDGVQLLKFVQSDFAELSLAQKMSVFSELMKSCLQSLTELHKKNIAHRDAQLKNFIKALNNNDCTVIDLGSALLNAKSSQMENDFLTLADEFKYFDSHFTNTKIETAWQEFKSAFKALVGEDKVTPAKLIEKIDAFRQAYLSLDIPLARNKLE